MGLECLRPVFAAVVVAVCLAAGQSTAAGQGAEADRVIGGVPLPGDVAPASADTSPFAGVWVGSWGGVRNAILVVEAVEGPQARVVYALADAPDGRLKAAWYRLDATLEENRLIVRGQGFTSTYTLTATGRLRSVFSGGGYGLLTRARLAEISRPGAEIAWNAGETLRLPTALTEDGAAVHLETILYRPAGPGPFPLAVISHGSTGSGRDPERFGRSWVHPWFAERLAERGWLVAFPQRRGRGASDGLYDEGFGTDRARGYTCEAGRTLAGAERALADLDAAIAALRARDDVRPGPVLLAGQSRGGALSVAYAGRYPDRVLGVVNFVGGWLGQGCRTADAVNGSLFARGGDFRRPMLWIYGEDDPFYSLDHSRRNHRAFREAGGKGRFHAFAFSGESSGHWAMWHPEAWHALLDTYLAEIARPGARTR
ncbi:MAG: alpha/beta fold hydrolase [Pseudomonadota bacterium]